MFSRVLSGEIRGKLVQRDCLEIMPHIPDKSIDMILCDLPYGTTQCRWDTIIPFEPLWEQYKRIIRDHGAIALTASQPFTSALVMSNLKMFRYELIWDKGKGSNPLLANKMPMKSHENICVFYKKAPTYNPQMIEGRPHQVPRTGGSRTNRIVGARFDKEEFRQATKDTTKRFPLSILKYSIHCGSKLHPTEKPVGLFEYLIKTYTNENDLILDNCLGSGSTAIAAENLDRRWIGIELDSEYYKMARKRIEQEREERARRLF